MEKIFRYSRKYSLDNINVGEDAYTLGLSQYFKGHNLKIQTDYTIYRDLSSKTIGEGEWRFKFEVGI